MNLFILHYKNDPQKWWEDNNVKLLTLYILVMRYLCIPVTSAPIEHLWGIASKFLTKERNQLDLETVASLVFLRRMVIFWENISKKLMEDIECVLEYLLNK